MEEGRGQEVTPTERTQLVTSQETIDGNKSAMLNFYLTVGIAEVFGVVAVGVTVIWMAHYRGGFAWDGSAKEFNYHPIFMVLGFVFLYGNGKTHLKWGGGCRSSKEILSQETTQYWKTLGLGSIPPAQCFPLCTAIQQIIICSLLCTVQSGANIVHVFYFIRNLAWALVLKVS